MKQCYFTFQMLLALSGWMSGYGGGFPFDKPGDLYGDEKYVGMRVVSILVTSFFTKCSETCGHCIQMFGTKENFLVVIKSLNYFLTYCCIHTSISMMAKGFLLIF